MKRKVKDILEILNSKYPDAHCELNYNNDFELLTAITLSAQTTDISVNKVTPNLFKKFPTPQSLIDADIKEIEAEIKSIGLYRNKAKNLKLMSKQIVYEYNNLIPNKFDELIKLAGVGVKTANVFLGEYHKIPSIAVDTHVLRVSKRLGLIEETDDVYRCEEKLKKIFPKKHWIKLHHQLIFFGRYECKARIKSCKECCLSKYCDDKKEKK